MAGSTVEEETVLEEYPADTRIVETVNDYGHTYQFEAPAHEGKEFDNPDLARLYADVYFVVDAFREEKSGERGVPPAVAMDGKDTIVAYLVTLPGTSVEWVSRMYGISEGTVRTYLSRVRQRGEDARENFNR